MTVFYAILAAALAGAVSYLAVFGRLASQGQGAIQQRNREQQAKAERAAALAGVVSRVLPQSKEVGDKQRRRIASAGLSMTPATYHGLSIAFYALALAVLVPLLPLLDIAPAAKTALALAVLAVVFLCPRAALSAKPRRRCEQIKGALPRALDLLAISVEAGLTPQRAIRIVAQHSAGPLAHEFELADRDMALLRYSLAEALSRMADRCGVDALTQFVAALSAGTAVGASVGDVLKSQSKHVFARRTQELKALANKLPVKMIMPIGFLMLPDVILAFGAPIAISMISMLSGVQ